MAIPVLIVGESGSGKTFSLKNFPPKEIGIFAVEKGNLPFKDPGFSIKKQATYNVIKAALAQPKVKAYVIDDSQYLMANEVFDRAKETGYGKFTDIALNFRNLIHFINTSMPDDVIVYFLHHSEYDATSGKYKVKTAGKMLDNQLTVEGCFNIVLFTEVSGGDHWFITQNDGTTTAKSPYEMFESEKIPNDLKAVDTAIRKFYNL